MYGFIAVAVAKQQLYDPQNLYNCYFILYEKKYTDLLAKNQAFHLGFITADGYPRQDAESNRK